MSSTRRESTCTNPSSVWGDVEKIAAMKEFTGDRYETLFVDFKYDQHEYGQGQYPGSIGPDVFSKSGSLSTTTEREVFCKVVETVTDLGRKSFQAFRETGRPVVLLQNMSNYIATNGMIGLANFILCPTGTDVSCFFSRNIPSEIIETDLLDGEIVLGHRGTVDQPGVLVVTNRQSRHAKVESLLTGVRCFSADVTVIGFYPEKQYVTVPIDRIAIPKITKNPDGKD